MFDFWRGITLAAILYGLMLAGLDMLYARWRFVRTKAIGQERIHSYMLRSFLVRLSLYLLGLSVAVRVFSRTGILMVGAVLLLSIRPGFLQRPSLASHRGVRAWAGNRQSHISDHWRSARISSSPAWASLCSCS